MKLICPHCMKPVPVADDFTGQQVTCPSCMKSFDAPARYIPAVLSPPTPAPPPSSEPNPSPPPEPPKMSSEPAADQPPPPPGLVPPTPPPVPPQQVAQSGSPPLPPLSPGYTRERALTVAPKLMMWLPPILLTLTLLLTFFPWVASHTGGATVQSQSAWGAMFGGISRNFALEESTGWSTGWIDSLHSDWELLIPFILALLVATAFAWADRGFHSLDPRNIPPLAKLWPWRKLLIVVLAGLAWLLLLIQSLNGFGMERALKQSVVDQFQKQRDEAASRAERAKVENRQDQTYAAFNVEHTTWLHLALTFTLLATLAELARMGLDRRGNKPPPRFVIQY